MNEGNEKAKPGPDYHETITTTYDVPNQDKSIKRETKLRYLWIIVFYCFFPLCDLISDAIITGIVSTIK